MTLLLFGRQTMEEHPIHQGFRNGVMLVWLAVGGFAGLFWRELFDFVTQAL